MDTLSELYSPDSPDFQEVGELKETDIRKLWSFTEEKDELLQYLALLAASVAAGLRTWQNK